jgi:hypothetical protein
LIDEKANRQARLVLGVANCELSGIYKLLICDIHVSFATTTFTFTLYLST